MIFLPRPVHHGSQPQRLRQVLPQAAVQGLPLEAADQDPDQHEVDVRVHHPRHRLCMLQRPDQHLPEILPLPGIERIPVRDGGCVGQQMVQRNPRQPLPQIGIPPDLRKQLLQRRLQLQPAPADQPQDLRGRGDLGQAGHVEQGILPGFPDAHRRQRSLPIKDPHARAGKVSLRPVPLRQVRHSPSQPLPLFF